MPTAFEKTYGAVKFYDLGGTAIFDTEDDLDLWTTMDDEPSPEPKWIRVNVPGADGAVDLSRALAGQTTYEMREIRLGFGGKCADHATALALVHQMRRALHGARVRVETLLTAQISGYYVADCECDGTADAGGGVEVTVTATADPFIRVGNQTLELPFSAANTDFSPTIAIPSNRDAAVSSYFVNPLGIENSHVCPIGADVVRLWWAMGDNLLDPSMWPYVCTSQFPATINKQVISLACGTLLQPDDTTFQLKASNATGTWPSWPYSFPFGSFEGRIASMVDASGVRLVAHVTGTVYNVGTMPQVILSATANGTGTDVNGFVLGSIATTSATLATGSVDQTLVIDPATATWSGSGATALSAITILADDVSAQLNVRLMLTCDPTLTTWEPATLGHSDVTLDAPIGWYEGLTGSDQVQVLPYEVTVNHKVTHEDGTSTGTSTRATVGEGTSGGMPASGATYVTAALMCDGGPSNSVAVWASMPVPSTATGTNTTMRSTPSITSGDGASITIDGRTATVGPGTVALPALVIPGGTFTVDYALFGSNPTDGTLTWEGGVL